MSVGVNLVATVMTRGLDVYLVGTVTVWELTVQLDGTSIVLGLDV